MDTASSWNPPALEETFDSMHPRGLLQLDFHLSFKSDINWSKLVYTRFYIKGFTVRRGKKGRYIVFESWEIYITPYYFFYCPLTNNYELPPCVKWNQFQGDFKAQFGNLGRWEACRSELLTWRWATLQTSEVTTVSTIFVIRRHNIYRYT